VAVSGGGEHLKLRGREERVERLEIKDGEGCCGGSSPRGGGCGGGGFDSGTVDDKLQHTQERGGRGLAVAARERAEPGHGRATLQLRTGERGSSTCGTSAMVPGGAAKFDSISNFKRIQILSKFDRSKKDLFELKILK
jgi:hypothetical protein